MTIQSGERSILPFGVAEIDARDSAEIDSKRDIFVKSKTHVIGRKRRSAVRDERVGSFTRRSRVYLWAPFWKKSNSMRWQFFPFPASGILNWRIWDAIKVSLWNYCGESSIGFFGSGSGKFFIHRRLAA